MKKIFKQIGILLLAVCMACCAVALVACGETEVPPGPGDTTKTYTATVLDPAGEPLEGVKVKWGTAGNAVTDKDGKASATLKSADYDVTLEELSPIYKAASAKATASSPDTTLSLEWNPEAGKVVYTVKVVYPDNKPAEGVKVQLCIPGENGQCFLFPIATNAKGEAYSIGAINEEFGAYLLGLEPAEYEAQITANLPAGYTYDGNDEEHQHHFTGDKATAEKLTVTITLKAE